MNSIKALLAIIIGLAIGYLIHPLSFDRLEHSRYLQLNFTNPLMQVGGCLCFVYVVWFFVGPLRRLANQPSYQPEQPIDDLAFAEGVRAMLAFIGLFVAIGWVFLQFAWLRYG